MEKRSQADILYTLAAAALMKEAGIGDSLSRGLSDIKRRGSLMMQGVPFSHTGTTTVPSPSSTPPPQPTSIKSDVSNTMGSGIVGGARKALNYLKGTSPTSTAPKQPTTPKQPVEGGGGNTSVFKP